MQRRDLLDLVGPAPTAWPSIADQVLHHEEAALELLELVRAGLVASTAAGFVRIFRQ